MENLKEVFYKKIIIKNDHILGSIELDFTNENNTLYKNIFLIGDNGCGKSHLLKLISLNIEYISNILFNNNEFSMEILLDSTYLKNNNNFVFSKTWQTNDGRIIELNSKPRYFNIVNSWIIANSSTNKKIYLWFEIENNRYPDIVNNKFFIHENISSFFTIFKLINLNFPYNYKYGTRYL